MLGFLLPSQFELAIALASFGLLGIPTRRLLFALAWFVAFEVVATVLIICSLPPPRAISIVSIGVWMFVGVLFGSFFRMLIAAYHATRHPTASLGADTRSPSLANGTQPNESLSTKGLAEELKLVREVFGRIQEEVKRAFNEFGAIDPKFMYVAFALVFACILALVFNLNADAFPQELHGFWPSFYASWLASVLFFLVVGSLATVVTLVRPEHRTFDSRVRILMGGRAGSLTTYMESYLRNIPRYLSKYEVTYYVEDYDETRNAALIRIRTSSISVNVFHDVATTHFGVFAFWPDPFEPPLARVGVLIQIAINDVSQLPEPQPIPAEGIKYPISSKIALDGDVRINTEYRAWHSLSEDVYVKPTRFTATGAATIVNSLESSHRLTIQTVAPPLGDAPRQIVQLAPFSFALSAGLPEEKVLSFRLSILPPLPAGAVPPAQEAPTE